jgi:ornithine carbamoyltransferase
VVAKVMEGFYDGLIARVFEHDKLAELAGHTKIGVINALSDREHPCQILADLLTIQERLGTVSGLKIVFLGDGNNVARSLAEAAKIVGSSFTLIGPKAYHLDTTGISQTEDLAEAKNADVLVTDTWVSMGDEKSAAERKKIFAPYQLNTALLSTAKKSAIVLHCLPAHWGEEITEEVLKSAQSAAYFEAHNRLPVQKAVMVKLFQ